MAFSTVSRSFSGSEFKALAGLLVYAWKRGDRLLYVGQSSNGLARALKHNIIGVAESVLDSDEILVWQVESWEAGAKLELELQLAHNPPYSGRKPQDKNPRPCRTCKEIFQPTRAWQVDCKNCR